jgi:hypothetical protein
MKSVLFDNLTQAGVIDGLRDQESYLENVLDHISAIVALADQDEITDGGRIDIARWAGFSFRHLDRILGVIRKTIDRLKFSNC